MKHVISRADSAQEAQFTSVAIEPRLEGILPFGQSSAITAGDVEFAFSGTALGKGQLTIFNEKFVLETGPEGFAFKLFSADVDRDGDEDYLLGLYDDSEAVCPATWVTGFTILMEGTQISENCDPTEIGAEILKRGGPIYAFDPCAEPLEPDNRWQWGTLTPEQSERNGPSWMYPYVDPRGL